MFWGYTGGSVYRRVVDMLHALLHRKLDESIPEPQRLEDALTSTVFGTLVCVDAWVTLARWMGVNYALRDGCESDLEGECWFWPRLAFAEPDAVLRIGDTLIVVEAKLRSGLHHLAMPEGKEARIGDQLVRQYDSIQTPPASRGRYAELLERAIRDCRLIQVVVVDARRMRRARREYEESRARLPADAALRLVTWQSLFRLLTDPALSSRRWGADLRAYLELSGLDTFEGVGRRLDPPNAVGCLWSWRSQRAAIGLRRAVLGLPDTPRLTGLRLWSPRTGPAVQRGWARAIHPAIVNGLASERVLGWRGLVQ